MLIKRILFYSRKVNYYRHYYNLKQIIWQRKSRVYAGLTDFLIDATVKLPGVNSNNCRKDSGCNVFCCVDRVFEMTYTEFSDCSVETYEACRRGRVWGSLPLFVLWNARACLKNHFRNLQAPLCGIFYPHSVAVARYAALIRIKSPTNWDSQLTKSFFQTRSGQIPKNSFLSANSFSGSVTERE